MLDLKTICNFFFVGGYIPLELGLAFTSLIAAIRHRSIESTILRTYLKLYFVNSSRYVNLDRGFRNLPAVENKYQFLVSTLFISIVLIHDAIRCTYCNLLARNF